MLNESGTMAKASHQPAEVTRVYQGMGCQSEGSSRYCKAR